MNRQLQRLQAALSGRFEIEHELGRGGMAVVYLGRDPRLGRRVAIKVFEQDAADSLASERFLREIRVAAQLQHPNILTVHDSGEAEGLVYYVMPYIAGASLRERIEREGPLPVADAVRIGREVAEALDHAHRAGIVHRDIKPDNIMLADGVAVVADFGIARALEEAGAGKLTDTGLAIGTPNYMSPEQATASQHVDGRADIYALGCVLYEMLAGSPPFSGPTAQIVMARHTADAVPPLRTVRPIPASLETAVVKALAKLPADRWPTGRAFADALSNEATRESATPQVRVNRASWRRGSAVVLGGLLVAAIGWVGVRWLAPASAQGSPVSTIRSLAVLPVHVKSDSSQELLADGLMEALITGFWRVDSLHVPSSSRVLAVKVQDDPLAIGRALDVAAVLSTVVQIANNKIRVSAQLTKVADGAELWRQQFDSEMLVRGELKGPFEIQDEITTRIVDTLRLALAPGRRTSLARGVRTRDPQAYNLVLQARRLTYQYSKASLDSAIVLSRKALQRDSTYADAWVALADAYSFQSNFGPTAEVAIGWRKAVDQGIRLDSTNGEAYALRAYLLIYHEWELELGLRDLRKAVSLTPGSADIATTYAAILGLAGQHDSSLAYARRSVSLDSTSPHAWQQLGFRFLWAGKRDSALAASLHALRLDSSMVYAYHVPMNMYLDQGRRREADSMMTRMLRFGDGQAIVSRWASDYYRRSRDSTGAQQELNRLLNRAPRKFVSPVTIGVAMLAVGDTAGALAKLEEAVNNHDLTLRDALQSSYSPSLDHLPRYQAIVRKVYRGSTMIRNPFP